MRFVPDADLGPFDHGDAMWSAFKASGHVLSSLEMVDELFRYDGTHVRIMRTTQGDLFLEAVVDEGSDEEEGGMESSWTTIHFLPFGDEDVLRSTLNTHFAPTMTSYVAACGPITRMVVTSQKANGELDLRVRSMSIEEVAKDELPDPHMKPGRISLHGPFSDPYSMDASRAIGAELLPDHRKGDEIVVFHGCDRAWIARRPGRLDEIVYVACVADDPTGWVQHRFSFNNEPDLIGSLAAGAPTLDTYRWARWIDREVVSTGHATGTWVSVERIGPDDLGREDIRREAPTYATRADHDAEWPQFAMGPKSDGQA